VRKVNLQTAEPDGTSERDGYRWRRARVGQSLGAEQFGASVYELEEGQRSFPYHFHHGAEEWLLVLEGSPRVRVPDGERLLRRGDVVCFPAGEDGAHQVVGPGRFLVLSANRSPDSVEYPDSGKIGVHPPGKVFRAGESVDYWDGE
jgi:uncharacterized cupin superfamily protein